MKTLELHNKLKFPQNSSIPASIRRKKQHCQNQNDQISGKRRSNLLTLETKAQKKKKKKKSPKC